MRSVRFIAVLLSAAVLILPAAALGHATNAPPGNSAIDEYLETVPGASGNRPSNGGTGGDIRGDTKAGAILSPRQRDQLASHGSDGRALVDVVEATAPAASQQPSVPHADGHSPMLNVAKATLGDSGDGGGMGILLPLILLTALVVTVAAVLGRRTRSR